MGKTIRRNNWYKKDMPNTKKKCKKLKKKYSTQSPKKHIRYDNGDVDDIDSFYIKY